MISIRKSLTMWYWDPVSLRIYSERKYIKIDYVLEHYHLLDINACFWIVQIDTVEASSTSTLSNLFNLVRSYYLTKNSMTIGHHNQSYFNLVKTNIVLEDTKSPSQLPYHSFELLKDFNKVIYFILTFF
jgi:hypothetical protein